MSLLNRAPPHLAEMPRLIWHIIPDVSHVIISQQSAYRSIYPLYGPGQKTILYYTVSDVPIILSRFRGQKCVKPIS